MTADEAAQDGRALLLRFCRPAAPEPGQLAGAAPADRDRRRGAYPDTEIAITAEVRGSKAVICFRNHGDTIPEELARIFEQFYRLDAARSSSGGAGLGLAIARQIVVLHGGVIEARSAEDMIEFTVTLPLSQENRKNLHGEKEETRAEEQINK